MAPYRSKTGELVKLFHALPTPIYLLDAGRRIVFCNQALLSWVGCASGDLEGRVSNYHSGTEVADHNALAAGLAPPPATPGSDLTAIVACPGPDGPLRRRRDHGSFRFPGRRNVLPP